METNSPSYNALERFANVFTSLAPTLAVMGLMGVVAFSKPDLSERKQQFLLALTALLMPSPLGAATRGLGAVATSVQKALKQES
jgi:hypothetical protein